LAGADDTRSALNGGFGFRIIFALDRIDPKAKEASESFLSGTEADVALHEGNVTRKVENGIARNVVRLESIKIQELAKEIGGRKAEAALKVSEEDNILIGFKYRLDLVAWKPGGYSFRYPSRPV
jgi:hypothetical protein